MRKITGLLFLLSLWACSPALQEFETDHLLLKLNDQGFITSFYDKDGQQEYLPDGLTAPLLSVRASDSIYVPTSMSFDENTQMINLGFTGIGTKTSIKLSSYSTHLKFELANIEHGDLIELIIWGPYPTTINKSIGETVGVVRGETFAMGLQALNPKTLGGYPWKENDCMPQIDIFENEDLTDLSEDGKRYVLYRVEAAKPDTFGSTLQAYCRNRDKDRFAENWGHEQYLIPAYNDGGVIGSKIALFACPVENTLDVIGEIEIAENLPHPTIDGVWGKKAASAS
ncbi:MAG: hypothetical protein U9R60_11180, partial [Bacteroidota bacterium]|nr:hypothetical protein [Bacteroidota bacterium]